MKKKITDYVRAVGNLVELRNKRIAHRQAGVHWTSASGNDMKRAIRLAVEITDMLVGEECTYTVVGLDLRAQVLGNGQPA